MSDTRSRINPLVAVAAVSVTLFSLIGVAVMTGLVPTSRSGDSPIEQAPQAAKAAPPAAAARAPASTTSADTPPKRMAPAETVARPAPVRTAPPPVQTAATAPSAPAPVVCATCGTVSAVRVIQQQGEGSGLGAVAGGVAGAVLGNQVGGGSGRTIATIAGAAGGAFAGHQVERHVKSGKQHEVVVRMNDGSSRNFTYDTEPSFRPGDKVRITDNGTLTTN